MGVGVAEFRSSGSEVLGSSLGVEGLAVYRRFSVQCPPYPPNPELSRRVASGVEGLGLECGAWGFRFGVFFRSQVGEVPLLLTFLDRESSRGGGVL